MLDLIWWLVGGSGLEFKFAVGLAAVIAVLWFFRGTPYGIGLAALIAALLGANYLAGRGYRQAELKHQAEADKAIMKARKARAKADRILHDDIYRNDGFRRD